MKYFFLYFSLISIFFCSCNDAIDKSLISQTEKLNSPNGKFSLYFYFIESPMAFGSGFSAINIIDSKDKYDYKTRNFFRLNNDSPFWIKWKNEDTLMIK